MRQQISRKRKAMKNIELRFMHYVKLFARPEINLYFRNTITFAYGRTLTGGIYSKKTKIKPSSYTIFHRWFIPRWHIRGKQQCNTLISLVLCNRHKQLAKRNRVKRYANTIPLSYYRRQKTEYSDYEVRITYALFVS